MKLKMSLKRIAVFGLSILIVSFGTANVSFAHVTVKPAEAVTAGYQTFTVSVPNEKEIPTVSVKLTIPDLVKSATPTQKAGWSIIKEVEGGGEDKKTKSITWSGGEIQDGLRDEFTFSAKVPDEATELQWKAYQTYADGTVVAWDQASEGDSHGGGGNSGPFSVTKVVAQSSQEEALSKADQAAADAKNSASLATSIAVISVVLGLVAIFFATRKK